MIVLIKSDEWTVKKISNQEAKDFTCKHHFIKSFPLISWSYGLFYNQELRGVAVFCSPSSPNIIDIFNGSVRKNELMQLSRLALPRNSIKNEGSFLLSRAIKLFRLERKEVRCLITYCDIERGNLGTVFKASNWIEFGLSVKGGAQAYKVGTKLFHSRNTKFHVTTKLKQIKRSRKIRYVYYYPDFATKNDLLNYIKNAS